MAKKKDDKVAGVAEEVKVTDNAEDVKVTDNAEDAEEVKVTDSKKGNKQSDNVEVTYIKPRGEKSPHISVSLNGLDYIVPWNEKVKIPIGVKEIIDRSFAAMDMAEAYEDEIAIDDE